MKSFIDVEATGLNRNLDDIIQFTGILTTDDYIPIETINLQFRSDKISARILDIISLDWEDYKENYVNDFSDFSTVIYNFLDLTGFVLYGYNSSFDRDMIKNNMLRCGKPIPQLTDVNCMKKRMKLGVKIEELGYTEEDIVRETKELFGECRGFHDARCDTYATLLIAKALKL